MKILLIIHGLVRPDLNSVIDVKNNLLKNFIGHDCHCLLSTWNNIKDLDNCNNKYDINIDAIKKEFDYYLIESQPTKNDLLKLVTMFKSADSNNINLLSNVYGAYHLHKKMALISNLFKEYDYYVYCRSDLKIIINTIIFSDYTTPRLFWRNKGLDTHILNDHFFIIKKSLFMKVYNDINCDILKNLFNQFDDAEKIITYLITSNNINPTYIPNDTIKEYYINRSYKKWDNKDIDGKGRDSSQQEIDICLNIERI